MAKEFGEVGPHTHIPNHTILPIFLDGPMPHYLELVKEQSRLRVDSGVLVERISNPGINVISDPFKNDALSVQYLRRGGYEWSVWKDATDGRVLNFELILTPEIPREALFNFYMPFINSVFEKEIPTDPESLVPLPVCYISPSDGIGLFFPQKAANPLFRIFPGGEFKVRKDLEPREPSTDGLWRKDLNGSNLYRIQAAEELFVFESHVLYPSILRPHILSPSVNASIGIAFDSNNLLTIQPRLQKLLSAGQFDQKTVAEVRQIVNPFFKIIEDNYGVSASA